MMTTRASSPDAEIAELRDHVVIGGFGRVGQTIARVLDSENVPWVAFDTNGELVTEQREAGRMVYFGDREPARIPGARRRQAARAPSSSRSARGGDRAHGRRNSQAATEGAHVGAREGCRARGTADAARLRRRRSRKRSRRACSSPAACWKRSIFRTTSPTSASPISARGARGLWQAAQGAKKAAKPKQAMAASDLDGVRSGVTPPSPFSGSRRSCRGSRWSRAISGRRRQAARGPWS